MLNVTFESKLLHGWILNYKFLKICYSEIDKFTTTFCKVKHENSQNVLLSSRKCYVSLATPIRINLKTNVFLSDSAIRTH